ncbi:MAG: hypothetical protein D8M57_18625 [Candidatus Scalindua sp. AMX11]|nr:MAG: hypothetical protein DWQ00_17525 [Candidatus Scalindua sp.]NOG83258.1 hypothetical protein [Planctomycetota bacterium]RZV71980.1 MAG: hypothetical protein EX341_14730 [Candidatus Scalindua sp. SCAELEC01]TDE63374.1 MAG: hypothetical protein D8M57_18625 [Candidatus Scalindua sp. AMX11]GJQ60028.1 MAG: hypothetical protein SCALA701_28290 [Candidatus Scalindua sp.]
MRKSIKITLISICVLIGIIAPINFTSLVFCFGYESTYAATIKSLVKYQAAIECIKNKQTGKGSVVSEHVNEKKSGHTTVKMLEIPEDQLKNTIHQWGNLGYKINEDTIKNDAFVKYLINHTDIRAFSYTAKVPFFFFLVKKELAEKVLYGGKINKFFRKISFPGWFRIAGALDEQGHYQKGFEHLASEKQNLISLFEGVLSKTVNDSYTIVELFTDVNGVRKGQFKFFETSEQSEPTFIQPIDTMAAFVLIYLNLVEEDPGDKGIKEDLSKPIVERLATRTGSQRKIALLNPTIP